MRRAAVLCDHMIFPLRSEWWDFRFPEEYWINIEPIRDADLHPYQRLVRLGEAARSAANAIEQYRHGTRSAMHVPDEVVQVIDYAHE